MFKKFLFIVILGFGFIANAQTTIKTMFYNLLEFPSALPANRGEILKDIVNQYNPDIFMVCELENEAGADIILNTSLNSNGVDYVRADFTSNQSSESPLQQLIFFRKGMFSLESSEILQNSVRDINHYTLKLSTTDQQSDPILLEIFVAHLKSSQGTANKNLRLEMVQKFTDRLNTLDPNSFVIFSGDFNLYTQSEQAYQELLDPTNAIVMADPINRPGSWSNNMNFQDTHTQSTRLNSGPFGAGAGGGLDDRFDFITISQNMFSDPKLNYIPLTYKAYGNNGNCFNNDISSPDCTGEFSEQIRGRLFNMSDHLPVVMDLQTNKQIVLGTPEFSLESKSIFLENTVVQNKLNVQIKFNNSENTTFEIFNVLGQKLMEINSNSENIQIDVSQLSNGIYYLKTNLPTSRTFKFLKTS